jgi:hypothetical protein
MILLTGLAAEQTTSYDAVYVDGQVTAASPITAFSINGTSLWQRQSSQLFFGYIAALQPGENRLLLEAADQTGTRVRQQVVVHRQTEATAPRNAQLRVTLLPLEAHGEAAPLAEMAHAYLLTALVKQGRFQVVAREQLDNILREQQLGQTALVEQETAVRIGKLAGAEGLLYGTVTATLQVLAVSLRFIDVESAALLAEETVYGEERSAPAMRTLMQGLAMKIRQRFPRLQGRVLRVEGDKVVVDLGRQQLTKPMKLLVFRTGEAITHPLTGQVLDVPIDILGEITIEAIFDDFAQGVLRQSVGSGGVQPHDHVILK